MKVKELRGYLKFCRLLKGGKKVKLQDILIHEIKEKVPIGGVVDNKKIRMGYLRMGDLSMIYLRKTPTNFQKKNYQKTEHWQPLIPLQTMVDEPINPRFKIQAACDPTIDKEYESFVPINQNFSETFN